MPRRLVLAALMWHTIHQLSAPFLSVRYTPLSFALADSGGHGTEPTDPGDEEENPIDTGESEPFPALPQQYSTNVLVTFQELGYTLEYTEYYDAHLNKSRHDTVAPDSLTIIKDFYDWNTDEAYQSNGTKCGITHLPVSTYEMPHVGPSVESWFFKIGPTGGNMFDAAQFEGLSLERRGILCNVFSAWHVIHPSHDLKIDYDIRYYFAAASDDPVAVMIYGTRVNTTSGDEYHFRHYYDWSVWLRGPPSDSVFELPTECATPVPILPEEAMPTVIDHAADSNSEFHQTHNQTNATTVPTSPPRLASRFTAVLETRLDDSSSLVNEVEWYFDKEELRERMDYYVAGREGEDPVIYINRYLEGSAATVVYIEDETGCRTTAVSVKGNDSDTMSQIPTPLHTLHAGSVPELFAGINHNHRFHGTYTVRGVPCDVWRANLTRTRDGIVYNLTEDVYFFPDYWQFPMRSVYDSVGNLPVRIAISGHYLDPDTGDFTPYSEEWNFFMGIPLEPAAEHFQLHCPDFLDTSSSTHAIIALFLVCLVVAASCLLGACYYWRHRFHKPGLKHHYNMHDLKHFVRQEMKRRQKAEAARHRRLSVATHLSDGDQPRSPLPLSAVCGSPNSQAAVSDSQSTDNDSQSSVSEPLSTRSSPGANMFSFPVNSPSNDQSLAGMTRIVPFTQAERHELVAHPLHEAHPTHSVNLNAYDPLARSSLRSSFSAAVSRVGFRLGFGSRYSFGAGHSFDDEPQVDAPISTGGARLQSEFRMRNQEIVPLHPMPVRHSANDSLSDEVAISIEPSSSDPDASPFHSPDMLP